MIRELTEMDSYLDSLLGRLPAASQEVLLVSRSNGFGLMSVPILFALQWLLRRGARFTNRHDDGRAFQQC